jgi:hypothetical protein
MSLELISHSPDLQRLQQEGYEIEIRGAHLLIHNVPYATSQLKVAYGILITPLELAGDQTARPSDHVAHFDGETPCDAQGSPLTKVINTTQVTDLGNGITSRHTFSSKPPEGYPDYFEKMHTYIRLISAPAQALRPEVTAKNFRTVQSDTTESVFRYEDSNSTRADIKAIADKVGGLKVAIIGVGGTGSYVLDFVSKTPVSAIHIFDGDVLLSHNAFRAPGAAPLDTLRRVVKKVDYLHGIYTNMHRHIIPHAYHLGPANVGELAEMDFVFVCIDEPEAKHAIIGALIARKTTFVDVGIGVEAIDGSLTGSVRVTTATPEMHDHLAKRISLGETGKGAYDQNIQIAELNALNAAMAVQRWKKLFGIYHDLEHEHHSVYEINVNRIVNDEATA